MKTTITIEASSPLEAAEILAKLTGTEEIKFENKELFEQAAREADKKLIEFEEKKEANRKARAADRKAEREEIAAAKKAENAAAKKEEVQETEVVETTRTVEEVIAKAKELVAAHSPVVLRGVLDEVIGEGVKIGDAPAAKYDDIFNAIEAKLS